MAVFGPLVLLASCASSIVDGEYLRTTDIIYPAKSPDVQIAFFMLGDTPDRQFIKIGRVSARAYVLETGVEELKAQARELGADAVIEIKYERKFSANYLEDLYFLDGDAVTYLK